MPGTESLTDFLLAQITEDEAVARAAVDFWSGDAASQPEHDFIARHDPARVLAECEAKRRIVRDYLEDADHLAHVDRSDDETRHKMRGTDFAMRCLALPYADHPDHREEWRP